MSLCSWLSGPALAEMPAGSWHGNGLVSKIELSQGWKEGNITLSKASSHQVSALEEDHNLLSQTDYRFPVKMLISVDEIVNKAETVILFSDNFAYNVVLRYIPKDDQFKVIWFDRKDQEIPNDQQILIRKD